MRSTLIYSLLLASASAAPLDPVESSDIDANVMVAASAAIPVVFEKQSDGSTIVLNATLEADFDYEDEVADDDLVEGDLVDGEDSNLERREAGTDVAETYRRAVINHHNYHRANHSAPNLVWSVDMANRARKIANGCVWAHKMDVDGGGYGQNLAVGLPGPDVSYSISDLFYNGEVNAYGNQYGREPDMNKAEAWGHMTQVVWKSTKAVGCATVDCSKRSGGLKNWPYNNGVFTVCNYSPPGNYVGEYKTQVGRPLNRKTIRGAYNVNRKKIAAGKWQGKNL
ncbi:Repressed by EFG1 protein 1 [Sphaceloma murrayae]|uniref:Repressed by EFG1 protein 1 n=1 Tax=Sphaceloma murrayae TaxID=2082308 RepID=A0A2K1QKD4_9PEZI|nr:Repressed by EFG1 protein 1 [Sphaceloma murrayae]